MKQLTLYDFLSPTERAYLRALGYKHKDLKNEIKTIQSPKK